jgi:hypothetical protein
VPKTDAKKRATPTNLPQVEFINYDLTKEDKAKLHEWRATRDFSLEMLIDTIVDSSYNLSVKFDAYNHCFGAFLTPRLPDTANAGYILTGRGSTACAAITGVLFRHFVLFEGEWPTDLVRRGGIDDD